jgi:hypothetical protein
MELQVKIGKEAKDHVDAQFDKELDTAHKILDLQLKSTSGEYWFKGQKPPGDKHSGD